MNKLTLLAITSMGAMLVAQTPSTDAQPAPAAAAAPAAPAPVVKLRGSIWASGEISDKTLADGTMPFHSMDAANGGFALDGATLGADITLTSGWGIKLTVLGGNMGKLLNYTDGEAGPGSTMANANQTTLAEAQLIWTGASDTFKIGRMWTPLGMEVADQTANITATRGILFCNVLPLSQVGVNWHHAFAPSFSIDLYAINGEDKVVDNNQGKTYGLQFTYNHGGAADKFATLIVFRGPELSGLGADANKGAEGQQRERGSFSGQWVWGASTLQWEADYVSNPDLTGVKTKTKGVGLIYKNQFTDNWAGFARAETIKSTTLDASLKQTSFVLGAERKWGSTFARFELRHDSADKGVYNYADVDGKAFDSANSATLSFGASF